VMVAYESSYGLTISPFQNTPDPRFLFRSQSHQEALDRLLYAVEAREMAVLVGRSGNWQDPAHPSAVG
jgi:general secretion pathway protein A